MIEPTTKNYVVHELAQHRGAPRPSWADNMKAMFGDHVKWEELKVYVGKNRPYCK
jgi:vacuolar protein sorting-associated protein 72